MFRFNPGAERTTVPAYNPYTISKCRSCDIPRDSLSLATPPDSQLCTACTLLHKMVKAEKESVIEQSEKKAIKDAAKEWAKRHLPVIADHGGQPAQRLIIRNNPTGLDFVLNKKFFGETFSNCVRADNTAETMELATRIEEWLPNATEGRIEKGRDHDFDFKVMNADFEGKRIEIKAKITAKELILYTMRVYK